MLDVKARLAVMLAEARGRQDGQGLAEYSLVLGLIAIVAIVALLTLGSAITGTLHYDWTHIQQAAP